MSDFDGLNQNPLYTFVPTDGCKKGENCQFENPDSSGLCSKARKSSVSSWNPVSGSSDLFESSPGKDKDKIYACRSDNICLATKSLPQDVKPCCGKDKPITEYCCNCDVLSPDYMKGCFSKLYFEKTKLLNKWDLVLKSLFRQNQ